MHFVGKKVLRGAVAAAACVGVMLPAIAGQDDGVDYPEGFRLFAHVKSMIVEEGLPVLGDPANPLNVIGLHHIYANKKAMEGYRELNAARPGTVVFKDGSVIVFDLLQHVPFPSAETRLLVLEGERKAVAVMEKDAKKYAETGGWGFQVFDPATKNPLLDKATQALCFSCHKNGDPALPPIGNASGSDFVFSRLRD